MTQAMLNHEAGPPATKDLTNTVRDTKRLANRLSEGDGIAMEPDEWDLRGRASW